MTAFEAQHLGSPRVIGAAGDPVGGVGNAHQPPTDEVLLQRLVLEGVRALAASAQQAQPLELPKRSVVVAAEVLDRLRDLGAQAG